jgi:hypothetical protein
MKKIHTLLFITLFALSFYSCKKDSSAKDSTVKETKTIVGEWRTDYRIFEFYASGKLIDTNTAKYNSDDPDVMSLKEDGTGSFKTHGEAYIKFKYTVTNTAINFTEVSSLYNGKWSPGNDLKYTIISFNTNELYYAVEGSVSSPSPYDKYITRVHSVK